MRKGKRASSDAPALLAARGIRATLDVEVEVWDQPNKTGAYDLKYRKDERDVAVEVKRVVNPKFRAASERASSIEYVRDSRLERCWDIRLSWDASWKEAQRLLPDLLVMAESMGWLGGQPLWEVRKSKGLLYEQLVALRVASAWSQPPTKRHPPGFYIYPEGWGGVVPSIEALPSFACRLLAGDSMKKLRRQLMNAQTDERHAFLFIGNEYLEAIALSERHDGLPSGDPELPPPIDGLWLANTQSDSRLIAWLPQEGWIRGSFG